MTELKTIDLSVGYQKHTIIKQLTLTIPEGQIVGVIGPNGSGKSTLLKALARVLFPQKGTVLLDGRDIQTLATKEVAKKISLLTQTSESTVDLSVEELVAYGRFPYQKGFGQLSAQDQEAIQWAIEATGLSDLQTVPIHALSGGQKQRVWIAMALAQDTDIVILDEPTTFLDPAHQLEVLQLLQTINQRHGKTILLSIHDLNLASRFCDHLYALKDGELLTCGTPEQVLTKEWLGQLFAIDAQLTTFPNSTKPLVLSYELRGIGA